MTGSAAQTSNHCAPAAATGLGALTQQTASSLHASPPCPPPPSPPSALWHNHTHCQADVCCQAPATPSVPQTRHGRRTQKPQTSASTAPAQHVCHDSSKRPAHSQPLSSQVSASLSSATGAQSREADQKLLWWPLDHVTVQGSRLAVGDSCYVITGHCVVCQVDDEHDMVECTLCRRFTHFVCACPKLTCPPQVNSGGAWSFRHQSA